jgi:hypothetical protein
MLLRAAESITRLVSGPDRWERFVWTVTDQPRLHTHPARTDPTVGRTHRWIAPGGAPSGRPSSRCPKHAQAVFTIQVQVQPLADALPTPAPRAALHGAIASMSPAVLAYRSLAGVREPLLAWLADRCTA